MQSSKLYNEVRQLRDKDKHPLAHFETPYVVHLQNKYDIANPKPLFTFKHPNTGLYKIFIHNYLYCNYFNFLTHLYFFRCCY